jgi:hypothetical protein
MRIVQITLDDSIYENVVNILELLPKDLIKIKKDEDYKIEVFKHKITKKIKKDIEKQLANQILNQFIKKDSNVKAFK